MKIVIPVEPIRGSEKVGIEDAFILTSMDRWHHPDVPHHSLHEVEIDGVTLLCQGFTLQVEPQDVFVTFTAHNIIKASWDAYMKDRDANDWLEGSGSRTFTESETDPGELTQDAEWWPGCDLIVPVTDLEFIPAPDRVEV